MSRFFWQNAYDAIKRNPLKRNRLDSGNPWNSIGICEKNKILNGASSDA